MNRRHAPLFLGIMSAVALSIAAAATDEPIGESNLKHGPPEPELKLDHFRLSYSVHIDGNGLTKVWLPLAHNSAFQKLEATIPRFVSKHAGENGNEFGFAEVMAPADLAITYDVTRQEGRANKKDTSNVKQWLKADRLVTIDNTARKLALEVIKNISTDAPNSVKARTIYDYIVSTMKYDKAGEGWGRGDFLYACNALKGNCTDFHSLFIGLCRACDIPARFIMGLSVPEKAKGKIEGYHCWAEFFDPESGWVPVDASLANQTNQREFYFGRLDPHRIAFTLGRDLQLVPPQSGAPLNFMIYSYAERNGKSVPTQTVITYERKM